MHSPHPPALVGFALRAGPGQGQPGTGQLEKAIRERPGAGDQTGEGALCVFAGESVANDFKPKEVADRIGPAAPAEASNPSATSSPGVRYADEAAPNQSILREQHP